MGDRGAAEREDAAFAQKAITVNNYLTPNPFNY